jgi:hypothetical protein
MPPVQPSYAKQFIEIARQAVRCNWCGRDKKLNRQGLCRHCNEVRKDLEEQEKLKPTTFTEKWYLNLAREKKKSCVVWGQMVPGILDAPVSGLSLEHWFRLIARRIARNNKMYDGWANMLNQTFAAEQRQVLAYMFWEIFGEDASHHRQAHALRGSHKWGL